MAEHKRQRRGGGNGGGSSRERRGGGSDRQGFTAFNMEDENDEGHFDADGNFIWDKEEKSVQEEAWLDTVSEEQIEAAKSAKDRKDYRDEQEDENMTEDQANQTLASLLRPRETVLQALQRLGKKRSKARGHNKRSQSGGERAAPVQTPQEKEQFDRITEAADFLLRIGEVDVYSQMKEEFFSEEELLAQRQQRARDQQEQEDASLAAAAAAATTDRASYFNGVASQQEAKTEEKPPLEEVMWEYKGADGAIHGPFPTSTFVAWRHQGYFLGDSAVNMRITSKGSDAPDRETKEQEDKPKVSAEEELMNDFEDSDDDEAHEISKADTTATSENVWKRSDEIDFESYQT